MTTNHTPVNPMTSLTKVLRAGLPALIKRGTGGAVRQLGHGAPVTTSADGSDVFRIELSNGGRYQITVTQLETVMNSGEAGAVDLAPWEAACQQCGTITSLSDLDGQGLCPDCAHDWWERLTPAERTAWCKANHQHYPYEDKGPLPPDQLQEIARLLEAHPFRLAVTAVRNPHWYTLRYEWADVGDAVFNDVVRTIREHGVTEWFGTYPWRMLHVNGFKYWTYYSSFVEEVIILNRKPIAGHTIPDETTSQ
jgi:predicted Zn-ribbon and HTH transcriptional regulator